MERLRRLKDTFIKKNQQTIYWQKILWGQYSGRAVGPLAMNTAIHFRLRFLYMECLIQPPLDISVND